MPLLGPGSPMTARSPRRRMVLHIGAPKTGTTYLQNMLWKNRRRLAGAGLYLPGDGQRDHFQAGRDVLGLKRSPNHPAPPWDGTFDALVNESRAAAPTTSLITDEALAAAAPHQVERAFGRLDGFDVDVVYATRDLVGLLASAWQESVKNANPRTLDDWLDTLRHRDQADYFWRAHDPTSVITRWRPAAGRVHLLTLPGRRAPDDELWTRLQRIVGWEPFTPATVRRANESLGFTEASLLAAVQRHLPAKRLRARVRDVVRGHLAAHLLSRAGASAPVRISPAHRDWIEKETVRRTDALRTVGERVVGDLADLELRPERFGENPLDADVVHAVARNAIASLLERGHRQRAALERLERRSTAERPAWAAWNATRELAAYGAARFHRSQFLDEAENRLSQAGIERSDPVRALEKSGEIVATLVVDQARRSVEIDRLDTTSAATSAIVSRVARLVRRT